MKLLVLYLLLLAIIATQLNNAVMAATLTVLASSSNNAHTIKCEMQSTDYTFVSYAAGESFVDAEKNEKWNCNGDDDILNDLARMCEISFSKHIVISGDNTILFSPHY